MKKNSLKSFIVIFAFSTLSAAQGLSLEQLQEQLFAAAFCGATKVVPLLLTFEGININEKNLRCHTALHIAASRGHTEVVKTLLATNGISVNKRNEDGNTALHCAAEALRDSTEIVKLLLAHGKNASATSD